MKIFHGVLNMRTTILQLLTATAVLAAPVAAQAGHIEYFAPTSQATVATLGDGRIGIRNGVQDLYYGDNGVVGTSLGGWQNSASTQSLGNVASSSANLVDGSLHAFAAAGSAAYQEAAFADARLSDSVWFTNTTDADIALDVMFTLDGKITNGTGIWQGGYGAINLFACGACGNDVGERVHFASGDFAYGTQYIVFDATGITNFGQDTTVSGPSPNYTYGSTFDAGYMTAYYATTIYIPKGQTTLGVTSALNLDCRFTNATCDFGNTTKIAFGPLAEGLSYTSASGAFLTANDVAPVPEPASWALMIMGFGVAGATLRRRRVVAA